MTHRADNPWASRFSAFDDPASIICGARHIPQPLSGLEAVSPAVAVERLRLTLEQLFVVTPKYATVLKAIGEHAAAGSDIRYFEKGEFKGKCYEKNIDVPILPPLCIVGLAGIGKSAIFRAAARVIARDNKTHFDDSHDPVLVRGFISSTVEPGDSDRRLLVRIAEQLDINAGISGDICKLSVQIRKIGYRDGVAGLHLDEFQHGTLSAANARITSLLLTARATGIPMVFACNFSLIHRLLERPQEDRDRLLTRVIVLTPETPDSEGWRLMVEGMFAVMKTYVRLDVENIAPELGRLSGCLPRNLYRLLGIAYGIAREEASSVITMKNLRDAYHSRAYASARSDVKAIGQISDGAGWKATKRIDLCCPEELIQDAGPCAAIATTDQKLEVLTRLSLEGSMTDEEKHGRRLADQQSRKNAGTDKVVPIKGKKNRSASDLLAAHEEFGRKK